jgi:cytochrome P450
MGSLEMTSGTIELDRRLASSAFVQDPYPVYRDLRAQAPVHWSDEWGVWVLTRYDDTLAVIRNPKTYSNAGRFSALLDQLPPELQPDVVPLRQHYSSGLIQSDPPDHTRLRGLVRLVFTPRAVEAFRGRVQTIVDQLLRQAASQGRFDLVRDFAYVLPVFVIGEMLGVPTDDLDQIFAWNTDIVGLQATGGASAEHARRAATAIAELESFFGDVIDEHRRSPKPDLISSLIEAQEDGDQLTRDELIGTCVTLLLAGHDTTKNLIANGTLALLRHPEARSRFQRDPAILPTAIEEMLRYESPIQRGWRRVAVDTEIRGRHLREGDLVYFMFGAANRDPEVFPDPDRFDIGRSENRHLAFGYGIHFCIGAPLARLEGSIALLTLFRQFPKIEPVDSIVEWQPSVHVRCPSRLVLDPSI